MDSVRHKSRAAKVSGSNLPQEMGMERLISGIHPQHQSWSSLTPACEWKGIACSADMLVTEIVWDHEELSGSLKLVHIPSSVTEFDIEENSLSGERTDLCDLSRFQILLVCFSVGIFLQEIQILLFSPDV